MNVPDILVNARAAPSPPRADPTPDEGDQTFQESLESKVQSAQDSQNRAVEKRGDEKQAEQTAQKEVEEKNGDIPVQFATVVVVPLQMIPIPLPAGQDEKQPTGPSAFTVLPEAQPVQVVSQNMIGATQTQVPVTAQQGDTTPPGFQIPVNSKTNETFQLSAEQGNTSEISRSPVINPNQEKAVVDAIKKIEIPDGIKVQVVQENNSLDLADGKLVLIDAETQTYAIAQGISTRMEVPENARATHLVQQVSQSVQEMTRADQHTIRLQIYPDDLGRIDVKLVSGSDGLQVILNADKGSTNRMLQDNLEQLQRSLLEAGIKVGGMSVGNQGAQENNSWQYKPQHAFTFNQPAVMNEPVEAIDRWGLPGMMSTMDARV